jgi:hypothetical protein
MKESILKLFIIDYSFSMTSESLPADEPETRGGAIAASFSLNGSILAGASLRRLSSFPTGPVVSSLKRPLPRRQPSFRFPGG